MKKPPFSWPLAKKDAFDIKLKKAKIQCLSGHPDFKKIHPDEVRDGAKNQFTILNQRVNKETQDGQDEAIKRRDKIGRKR